MKKKFFINSFRITSSLVFPLITLPYVTRMLQPLGFGKVDFANSIIAIFMMLSTLGIPTYGIRLVAQNRQNSNVLSENVKQLLLLQVLGILICYAVFFMCLFFYSKMADEKLLFLVLSLSILMNGIGIDWFFSGMEEYGYITIRNGAIQVISICLILFLVKKPSDYVIYAGISVLSSVGTNILNLFYLKDRINWQQKIKFNLLPHMKGSIVFFILILIGTSLTKLESIMIGSLMNYQDVGVYAAANKIIQCAIGVYTGIGMTFLPTLVGLMNNDKEKFNDILGKSIDVVYFIAVPTCVVLYILAPQLIDFVLGNKFHASIEPFRILTFVIFVVTLNVVVGNQIFVAAHKEKYTMIPLGFLAVFSPLINYVLIPQYGVNGAAISVLITSTLCAGIQLRLAIKINQIKLLTKHHFKYIIASILMALCILFFINLQIQLMVILLVAAVCYMFFLVIMKEYIILEYIGKISRVITIKLKAARK